MVQVVAVYMPKQMLLLIILVLLCLSTEKKGGAFYPVEGKKNTKLNIAVIRINKSGDTCNARPCYNCLNLMKIVGIRKIFYSVGPGEIVCESVKNMVSIQSSSVSKYIEKINGNKLVDKPNKYYEDLLIKNFPSVIKYKNLTNFIRYNFSNVLPEYNFVITGQTINFFDPNKNIILKANIA